MSSIICIIPVRYGSTRFPGKPLAKILGKPMVQWVWENAKKVKIINRVIIATDDKRIFDISKKFGAEVVMTSKNCPSGTDRIAEATKKIKSDIVVNLQGDEPLVSSKTIEKTINVLLRDKIAVVSTPVCRFCDGENLSDPNSVKVVFDKNNYAMYFSRSIIPFVSHHSSLITHNYFFKHIGLYVYKSDFLEKFVSLKESHLEKIEKLEQLRVLENGYKIKIVVVKDKTIPVDNPEDIKKVESVIKTGEYYE